MSSKKLFITGGSGYVGSTVIEHAIVQGWTVTAISRTPEGDAKITKLGADPVRGDLKSLDVLTREAAKADAVINIADSMAGDFSMTQEERFAINNASVDALVEGLKGSGKPLILTGGSLYVANDSDGKETDETSPKWPEGHPFRWNHEERNLAYKKDNIRVNYVRLAPYVYGRGGSGVKIFMNMFAKAGAGLYIDDGKAYITTVDVDDAARLYLALAETPTAEGPWNATSETHITQRQLAETICKALGVPCNAVAFKDAEERMGYFLAKFLSASNRASNKKAKEQIGWEIKAPKGILKDIESGSYVELAESLKTKA